MPKHPNNTIAEHLNRAQTAISNTLDVAEIQKLVAAFGYTAARMKEGQKLFEAAQALVNAQAVATGAQKVATAAADQAREAAWEAFQTLATVARAVFKGDPAKLTALGLTGPMPRTAAPFLAAGYALFDNAGAVAEIKTGLAGYGYNDAKLKQGRATSAAYDAANRAQEAAMGSAQQATQEQNSALNSLNAWVAQYLKIARAALQGKPQLLEKLGLAARTGKTKAQRGAPAKAAATRKTKKLASA